MYHKQLVDDAKKTFFFLTLFHILEGYFPKRDFVLQLVLQSVRSHLFYKLKKKTPRMSIHRVMVLVGNDGRVIGSTLDRTIIRKTEFKKRTEECYNTTLLFLV